MGEESRSTVAVTIWFAQMLFITKQAMHHRPNHKTVHLLVYKKLKKELAKLIEAFGWSLWIK